MFRRCAGLIVMVFLTALVAPVDALPRRNRAQRSIAELSCKIEFEDAMREAHRLRGEERDEARKAAHERYLECRRQARRLSTREGGSFPMLYVDGVVINLHGR
ncbi:MAG: hypothetical protein HY815_26265 [Candidatus Riflebacteria bacterium]|nr:hypothetical protein [Candidatus Riflebacteria bacterium]